MSAPVVGIVGDGQLARMMCIAAAPLGIGVRVLASSDSSSAAQVAPEVVLGDYTDLATLRDFAKHCDALTFDHEHVPPDHLAELQTQGTLLRPGPRALLFAQDKAAMRERLTGLGLPVPRWRVPGAGEDAAELAEQLGGFPLILKAARGGYDGKGVWRVETAGEAAELLRSSTDAGTVLVAEECVPFRRELAVLVARRPSGETRAYPVVETVQRDGICREVVAPARVSAETAARAQEVAVRITEELDVTGILAVEMFETPDGGVLVNELAMRPHNSGHWSIDGATVSQFEQHLRAVLDLPLATPEPTAPVTVMVNLLGGSRQDVPGAYAEAWAADPDVRVHLYGKEPRAGRKIGHVTVLGDDAEALLARGRRVAELLTEQS